MKLSRLVAGCALLGATLLAHAQEAAPAPAAQAAEPAESVSTPGVNPWAMGGAVAILGAVMLLAF